MGVTHCRPAAAVSLHQTGVTGPRSESEDEGDACRRDGLPGWRRRAPRSARARGRGCASGCSSRGGWSRRACAATHVARGSRTHTRAACASGHLEGAGHYGAGIARYLSSRGDVMLKAARSPRGEQTLRGKDDGLDATRAARSSPLLLLLIVFDDLCQPAWRSSRDGARGVELEGEDRYPDGEHNAALKRWATHSLYRLLAHDGTPLQLDERRSIARPGVRAAATASATRSQ